jgi:hypothetical protein
VGVPCRDVVFVVLLVGFWPFLEMFVLALVWRELISRALCERRELQTKLFCISGRSGRSKKIDSIVGRQFEVRGWKCGAW